MTLDAERSEIETEYANNAIAGVAVGYDRHLFTPSDQSIRITIISGAADQVSVGAPGSNIVRHNGIAMFEIYAAGGKGSATVRGHAETIMGIYRNKNLGEVKCRIPYIAGSRDEEPYTILNVAVPYTRDALNA